MQETQQDAAEPQAEPVPQGLRADSSASALPYPPNSPPEAPFPGDHPYSPQEEDADYDSEDRAPQPLTAKSKRRMVWAIALLTVIGLTIVLPPLVNVSRYQRRIASSIGASLGRPVHLDSVTLNVLPMPGFTLTNFVVSEDPVFGSEPVIRANTVRATLRMRSLWHRRVEFSKIALDEPSVNLVRRADGRWNIESILLQASRIPVAPTAQKSADASGIQRFPYIQATGARVNFKQGLEKKPISLLDADFALWLPQPESWHLRLLAHPQRTDTAAADSGTLRIEGTLGKAQRLQDVPVDIHAEWTATPLGAASWVLLGRDIGMRGEMTLRATVKGTVNQNLSTVRLQLERLRKADFVPVRALSVDVSCQARATALFHHLAEIKCLWPPDAAETALGTVAVTGEIPDIRHLQTARIEAGATNIPLAELLDVVRMESPRVSPTLELGGMIQAHLTCCAPAPVAGSPASSPASSTASPIAATSAALTLAHPRLSFDGKPVPLPDTEIEGTLAEGKLTFTPVALSLARPDRAKPDLASPALDGTQPALLTVQADATGISTHLSGPVLRSRLLALAHALPQFGDGLAQALPEPPPAKPAESLATSTKSATTKTTEAKPPATRLPETPVPESPIRVDLVGSRIWNGGQTWAPSPRIASPARPTRRHPHPRRKVAAP